MGRLDSWPHLFLFLFRACLIQHPQSLISFGSDPTWTTRSSIFAWRTLAKGQIRFFFLSFYTPSRKHVWGQVALLSKHLSEVLAELPVGSLSLQTLTDRDQELNEELFLDTAMFLLLCFLCAFSHAGQQLHDCIKCHWHIQSPGSNFKEPHIFCRWTKGPRLTMLCSNISINPVATADKLLVRSFSRYKYQFSLHNSFCKSCPWPLLLFISKSNAFHLLSAHFISWPGIVIINVL